MKFNKTLSALSRAAVKGDFVSFNYTKDTGEQSRRTVRFGGDIEKRLEKQGTPVNGKGNWISGAKKSGLRGMIVERGGEVYVRGTDVSPGLKTGHKMFLLRNISF